MQIGFMYGNHTFKLFNSPHDATKWLLQATHDDLYPIEMAFYNHSNVHKKYGESEEAWKVKCVEFFNRFDTNIQNFLIP